jgi:hypothetical protein
VINIGEGEPVPEPNMPGTWKAVVHNNTVTWLAHWKENINGQCKYVFLAATSAIKGKSDRDKFEKARQLKVHRSLPDGCHILTALYRTKSTLSVQTMKQTSSRR